MRTIAQISDLHFGAHEPALVTALRDALLRIRPDLVVVSGDLTQRARTRQFADADAFLAELEAAELPLLVVPGNHDVPMHKPLTRLLAPLRRYRKMVQRDRPQRFGDTELAVLGLSSAHGLTRKHGRLGATQAHAIERYFADTPAGATRVLVTHHPLVPLPRPGGVGEAPALRGAARALAAVTAARVSLVLAGHHHTQLVAAGAAVPAIDPHVLVVQAGTATSWRRRDAPNSFNLIEVAPGHATVTEWAEADGGFAPRAAITYTAASTGWVRA